MIDIALVLESHEKQRAALDSILGVLLKFISLVGALILARASDDIDLSNDILDETSAWRSTQENF